MVRQESGGGSLLSYFWTPIVAVGCSGDAGPNAQISVSVFGASAVPDRPRLLAVLYKSNYTHDLVQAKGDFSVTLLSQDQVDLIPKLGFESGRGRSKLDGLAYEITGRGNPVFPGGLGWLECAVIDQFDFGDATAYLSAVLHQERAERAQPLIWSAVRPTLPESQRRTWDEKIGRDAKLYRPMMRWLTG